MSVVLQIIACKEEEQKKAKCEIGFDSKECTCLMVLRELVAKNMVLHQELDDKKLLVTRLKKQCNVQNAELRYRDRKEMCCLLVAFYACIVAISTMFVR
jgi:hypothetical protein